MNTRSLARALVAKADRVEVGRHNSPGLQRTLKEKADAAEAPD
jgi:hypothetical protein